MNKENNVFVIDGDTSARIGLKRLLIAAGHKVKDYSSMHEFLESIGTKESGCLVLDSTIGGVWGSRLLDELSKRDIRLSIIVISTDYNQEDRKKADEMKAVGFFRKPVDGQALLDAIDWAMRSGNERNDRKKTYHNDN